VLPLICFLEQLDVLKIQCPVESKLIAELILAQQFAQASQQIVPSIVMMDQRLQQLRRFVFVEKILLILDAAVKSHKIAQHLRV